MEKIIETKNLGKLIIKQIDKQTAKELIIKNHYSHKWNDGGFGVYNFGVYSYDNPDKCLGCAVYGYMKNVKAKLISHPNPNAWMIELNRMWIDDTLGKNAESLLIAHSIKMIKLLDKNIVAIQSFADGRLGCGTIYKASNFKYFGYHYTKFLKHKETGEISHEQNFTNSTSKKRFIRSNIGFILQDWEIFRVKTYRYIYPLDKKVKIRFKEEPYPMYEKGQETVEWKRNIPLIKQRLKALIDEM
ncbi:Mom family adenine methylcarbamoylation protein [Faecalibacter bovis]|uniref:Uncharacterized protein n=1 Tax=Faecalibacter bovis TaxID=2898187 RepID=A0ABX7XDU0_9FLAO|nr:hypothetical protein [Faecalibacter bovis]QTV06074.1 hypothetical protein J9309_01615 [Faecalibacter bovis]